MTARRPTSSEHQTVSRVAASSTWRWQPGEVEVTCRRPDGLIVARRLMVPSKLRSQASVTSAGPSTRA